MSQKPASDNAVDWGCPIINDIGGYDITLDGSIDAIAAAAYVATLPPGRVHTVPGGLTVVRGESVHPRRRNRNPTYDDAVQLIPSLNLGQSVCKTSRDSPYLIGDISTKRFEVRRTPDDGQVTARFPMSCQTTAGGLLRFMRRWSARCPDVYLTVQFSQTRSYGGDEYSSEDVLISAARGEMLFAGWAKNCTVRHEKLIRAKGATQKGATPARGLKGAYAILMEGGPDGLKEFFDRASKKGSGLTTPIHRPVAFKYRWNGLNPIDAVLMYPLGHIYRSRATDDYAVWKEATIGRDMVMLERHAPFLDVERVNRLSALCAGDSQLAALVGSDFGYTANGCHAIAFMARAARPNSLESVGVARVLEHMLGRDNSPSPLVQQDRDRRTADVLLASGNAHAWRYLKARRDPVIAGENGAIESLTYIEDMAEYLHAFGPGEFQELFDPQRGGRRMLDDERELLDRHALSQSMLGLVTLTSPAARAVTCDSPGA